MKFDSAKILICALPCLEAGHFDKSALRRRLMSSTRGRRTSLAGHAMMLGVLVFLSPSCGRSCDMNDLPPKIRAHLNRKFPDWRIVTLNDLGPDNRRFYLERHSKGCPGFTPGRYTPAPEPSYAVLIVPKNQKDKRSKLLVYDKAERGYEATKLVEGAHEGAMAVVITMPSGTYHDSQRTEKVTTKRPVIVFVVYESGALMYYWANGEWHMLQISE